MRHKGWSIEGARLSECQGATTPNQELGEAELKLEQVTKEEGSRVPDPEGRGMLKSEHDE